MYEDRGNLRFLHKYDPACSTTPIDSWGHPVKDQKKSAARSVRSIMVMTRRHKRDSLGKNLQRTMETFKKAITLLRNIYRLGNTENTWINLGTRMWENNVDRSII
ncbi:hypothetical protein EVAR_53728_1 [Eumeta japonica]|uniref:Uncharacterized protein n=1 Tax=Eumeta variegata TaxID=151549 RepID=A0A4C1Z2S4_EUMVA|nr:hypothetical protein EVAR_53728_1 [Eumeta japonica]